MTTMTMAVGGPALPKRKTPPAATMMRKTMARHQR